MMVSHNICEECNHKCNSIYFQQNFINWTSGNNDIDKFIQDHQLSAHNDVSNVLEWIPYNKFYNIKYITKVGMYRANWIDGKISNWDYENQNWKRKGQIMIVTLKNLYNSEDITSEFMNEV
jgi:hypothetical protein